MANLKHLSTILKGFEHLSREILGGIFQKKIIFSNESIFLLKIKKVLPCVENQVDWGQKNRLLSSLLDKIPHQKEKFKVLKIKPEGL